MSANCTVRLSRSTDETVAWWMVAFFWCSKRSRSEWATAVVSIRPGRQLVEHGLETVVVVRVHQHDVHVRMLELPRCPQTGEPAAEDDDPWPCFHRLRRPCSPKHGDRLAPPVPHGITQSG